MYKLFIVEDDGGIARGLCDSLEKWDIKGYTVKNFRNIISEFCETMPDIVLLDISLPFFNGFHWCSEIRRISKVPIIFISSASDNLNMVMAMNMGADDFVAKPFDGEVLTAKILAILRRTYAYSDGIAVIEHRGAVLNMNDNTLSYNGENIPLTKNEYRILLCLMEERGRVVSREKLMEKLWATDTFVDENTLTVNVNRLRRKLDSYGLCNFIGTKIGVGYFIGTEDSK